jgi:hypothetical protein
MSPTQVFSESPRSTRLAGNDNETIVDELDTEAHRLVGNDNETVVDEDLDTEGHIRNRNVESNTSTTVTSLRRIEPDEGDEDPMDLAKARRTARR